MVSIELGRTRVLKYTLQDLRALEHAMDGKPIVDIVRDLMKAGIDALCFALVHGLKHEDPTLNPNLVMKMLDAHLDAGESLQPLFAAVLEALEKKGVFRTSQDVEAGKSQTPALT